MVTVTRRQLIDGLAALSIVAILAGLAYGLPALDRVLPSDRSVTPHEPYAIGAGVSLHPPSGAVLDVTGTRPGDDEATVLFRIGPVRYAIAVQPYDGTLPAAAARLRRRIADTSGYQVTDTQRAVATTSGLAGLQGGYAAPGRGGRYAVFLADRRTIEVMVSGTDLDLGRTLPAIEASTRTLRYERSR